MKYFGLIQDLIITNPVLQIRFPLGPFTAEALTLKLISLSFGTYSY